MWGSFTLYSSLHEHHPRNWGTGGLGHAVAETLAQTVNPTQLAVLARDPAKAADLHAQGIAVRQGDYCDYSSLAATFAGVEKLYFVATNSMTDRIGQHENVVKAAVAAGVKHVVYTSFQRKTEDGTSPVAFIEEAHLATEKLIKQSGLTYTILKHALYLDVFPPFFGPQVLENNTIYLPAGTGRGPTPAATTLPWRARPCSPAPATKTKPMS